MMSDAERLEWVRSKWPELVREVANDIVLWIAENWPELMRRVPRNLRPTEVPMIDVWATQPELMTDRWFSSWGARVFLQSRPPDGYFAFGCINRIGSEYLIAMWRQENRYFWFYDQYVCFHGSQENARSTPENTNKKLVDALQAWDRGDDLVIRRPGGYPRWYWKHVNREFWNSNL